MVTPPVLEPILCHSVHIGLQSSRRNSIKCDLPESSAQAVTSSRPIRPLTLCPCCRTEHVTLHGDEEFFSAKMQHAIKPDLHQKWHEISLPEGLQEDLSSTEMPLSLCAVPVDGAADAGDACEIHVELRVVANPLSLAQRARFSIYPPWNLGPDVRFSWRLEPRVQKTSTPAFAVAGEKLRILPTDVEAETLTPARFRLPLKPHQLQSLRWMQACELPTRDPLLLGATREFFPTLHAPHPAQQTLEAAASCRVVARVQRAFAVHGGILADQVGSGKTAVTLGLIESDLTANRGQYGSQNETLPASSANGSASTLVLAPSRLLSQWHQEVHKFLGDDSIRVFVIRSVAAVTAQDVQEMASAHLVLAPFELLRAVGQIIAGSDCFNTEQSKKQRLSVWGSGVRDAFLQIIFRRVVVDEFHEILHSDWSLARRHLRDIHFGALWLLSGTPPLGGFEAVAGMSEMFDIDLRTFRHQLDADLLARRTLDHLARGNSSNELESIKVHEELVSFHHTPAERTIYIQALAAFHRQSHRQHDVENRDVALLQLCSHFQIDDNVACGEDAEGECSRLSRERFVAMETAKEWLCASVHKMETQVLREQLVVSRELVAMEQYEQLLAEIGFAGVLGTVGMEGQISGARAAGVRSMGHRLEHEADALIRSSIEQVRHVHQGPSGKQFSDCHSSMTQPALLELLEDVKQAKDAFRQRLHEYNFSTTMLEAADAERFQCPICLEDDVQPCDRAILAGCAHLFCYRCALTISRGPQNSRECPLCRQELHDDKEVLRVREPGAILPAERADRRRWGQFGSKIFHVVQKLRDIEQEEPAARTIIFVQWSALRRKLAHAFGTFGIPFVSLEEFFEGEPLGKVRNFWERDDVVAEFQSAAEDCTRGPKVLLLSLSDAASGLNLTRAHHVFFVHPMVATSRRTAVAYEMQALGRCVRLGQRNDVFLWRFVSLATVEEEISLLHQQELWRRYPELNSQNVFPNVGKTETLDDHGQVDELDMDDLFW